jgi:hypothetical protein
MPMSATRRALLLLALLLAAPAAESAPAPVYKERPGLESAHRALPKPLRDEIERCQRDLPELIARAEHSSKLARTRKEKDAYLGTVENWKRHYYFFPVQHLEYQRKQPEYQSREDQAAIELALKFYRIQYAEAKKKRLFKGLPSHWR